jgi:hypothetical protein
LNVSICSIFIWGKVSRGVDKSVNSYFLYKKKIPVKIQQLKPSVPLQKIPVKIQQLQPSVPLQKIPVKIQQLKPSPLQKIPVKIQQLKPDSDI